MYGGLFGDLPAARNSKNEAKKEDEPPRAPSAAENATEPTTTDKKQDESQADHEKKNKKPRVLEEPKSVKGSSLVQKVGVAGTSMAFVPTHVKRKRNVAKKSQQQHSKPASISTKESETTTTIPSQTNPAVTKFAVLSSVTATPEEIINHHHNPTVSPSKPKEPEELRKLHESVTDPYDPMVPNDLLLHWDRQAAILERMEMEREARETIEQQNRVRQQMERERVELLKTGDVNALQARGRGRGVSNIPAWLVEKQKKEAQLGKPENA